MISPDQVFELDSLEITREVAKKISEKIQKRELPGLVLISGPLGAGKTQFSKFLLSFFGIEPELVSSPTFSLCNYYESNQNKIVHIDLYRLESEEEIQVAGLSEEVYHADLALIEWADKFDEKIWDKEFFKININFEKERKDRILTVSSL